MIGNKISRYPDRRQSHIFAAPKKEDYHKLIDDAVVCAQAKDDSIDDQTLI